MSACVLIPFDGDSGWRDAAYAYMLRTLAGWPISRGAYATNSKGMAVAEAADRAGDADVFVVHDADVVVAPATLTRCITAVGEGAPWAMPHRTVHRLTAGATTAVYDGARIEDQQHQLDRPVYHGKVGGGVTVLHRRVWDDCPMDPRFLGWGGEDEAWGMALHTLHGAPFRPESMDQRLWHLWHPHPAPGQRFPVSAECRALFSAYRRAVGRPDTMRSLLVGAGASIVPGDAVAPGAEPC